MLAFFISPRFNASLAVVKDGGRTHIGPFLHGAWVAVGSMLVMLAFAFSAANLAHAQEQPEPIKPYVAPSTSADPAHDILIEGLGFSKLILALELDEAWKRHPLYGRLQASLEKNLCWSGLYNLVAPAFSKRCVRKNPPRTDMRLHISPRLVGSSAKKTRRNDRLVVRLYEAGPERLLLFKESMRMQHLTNEWKLMALLNRMAKRITGKTGVLGSTIAFAMKTPRVNKKIVAVSSHGYPLRILSNNPHINLLPRFSPTGDGLTYTMLNSKGARIFYRSMRPAKKSAPKTRFISNYGSLNTGGSFSPDGKWAVITMSLKQNADLFLVDLHANRRRQITTREGIETQADWRPKSNELVMVSDRSGTPQIYHYTLDTREELRLTFGSGYNADPRWSPNGKHILFTRRTKGVDQIYIMDAQGENLRPVTTGRYNAEQADWSPDGKQIVFASRRTGVYKLYVVSIDGSNLRRLTNTGKRVEENSPSWSALRIFR